MLSASSHKSLIGAVLGCALAASLAGCGTSSMQVEDKEQMLVAAGFLQKPASTPERQARLAALPPFKVLSQQVRIAGSDSVGYVYADPKFCNCIFVGGPDAYQRFQKMAMDRRLADENLMASEMQEDSAFDWGMWGPYDYWGPGEIIVVPKHR